MRRRASPSVNELRPRAGCGAFADVVATAWLRSAAPGFGGTPVVLLTPGIGALPVAPGAVPPGVGRVGVAPVGGVVCAVAVPARSVAARATGTKEAVFMAEILVFDVRRHEPARRSRDGVRGMGASHG